MWGLGLLSAYDTGTVGVEATASSVLWLGWRQVHKQSLKLLHMHFGSSVL